MPVKQAAGEEQGCRAGALGPSCRGGKRGVNVTYTFAGNMGTQEIQCRGFCGLFQSTDC